MSMCSSGVRETVREDAEGGGFCPGQQGVGGSVSLVRLRRSLNCCEQLRIDLPRSQAKESRNEIMT